jgi:hypothetical protein
MFQTGYLTIKEIRKYGNIILDYPNREVRESVYEFMIIDMSQKQAHQSGLTALNLAKAFNNNDLTQAQMILKSLFSKLPYDAYHNQQEGFYHGLLHLVFSLMGLYIQSEVHTNNGRADCIITTQNYIFVMEFKFNKSAQEAIAQIRHKKYFNPYLSSGKNIILIGINFEGGKREFDNWAIENL